MPVYIVLYCNYYKSILTDGMFLPSALDVHLQMKWFCFVLFVFIFHKKKLFGTHFIAIKYRQMGWTKSSAASDLGQYCLTLLFFKGQKALMCYIASERHHENIPL